MSAVQEEKRDGELKFGLTRASDRAQAYLGMSSCTISRLLNDPDNLPAEGEVAGRIRGSDMSREDEAKIRPVIVSLVKRKIIPSLDIILKELQSTDGGWDWSRSTLYNTLPKIGFRYDGNRHNYYDRVRENDDNVVIRNRNVEVCG